MEYTSNTKPGLRDEADYYLIISYTKFIYHNELYDEVPRLTMTRILHAVNSCQPLFHVTNVTWRWTTRASTYIFEGVIGVSGGLPTDGTRMWLSKLTTALSYITRYVNDVRVVLQDRTTGWKESLIMEK